MLMVVLTLALVFCCATALAQSLSFDSLYATCELDDSYIILTPENLDLHTEWIENHHTSAETIQEDFAARNVLAQAWTADGECCVEFIALQDEWAQKYYDLDQQDTAPRASFRKAYLNASVYGENSGYKVLEAEWKKTSLHGRELQIKYKQTVGEETIRGYARAMVRNGYHIRIDYRVTGRNLKNADLKALDTIMGTWKFVSELNVPVSLSAEVEFTQLPPSETNTGKFTVSGTCDAGLRLVAVVLRMSSATPLVLETTASSKGKFSFENIKLTEEGIWLMTVTVMNGDEEVGEYVLNTITYQSNLLTMNFGDCGGLDLSSDLEQTITGDELTISGTTLGQVTIQCIVDGPTTYSKTVKTNNSGKFSFTVDTSAEGEYSIVLALSKKNANSRRFAIKATRTVTKEDLKARAVKAAIKPGYSTLTEKLSGYTGKIMVYKLYTVSVQQAGDEWIITMAMKRSSAGLYSNFVVVTTDEEPNLSVDSQHTMYGTCTGAYTVENEEGSKSYPGFELIYFAD